jgi:hypothetical protein
VTNTGSPNNSLSQRAARKLVRVSGPRRPSSAMERFEADFHRSGVYARISCLMNLT